MRRDPFGGYDEAPETLVPYAYGANNPITYSDPSGRILFDAMYGRYVENEICMEFVNGHGPERACDISFSELLGGKRKGPRPDLIDTNTHEIWEIGTWLARPIKRIEIDHYYLPRAREELGGEWYGGSAASFTPREVIWIRYPDLWAEVAPPDRGVISYIVIDMTAVRAGIAAATSAFMTQLAMHILTTTTQVTATRGL